MAVDFEGLLVEMYWGNTILQYSIAALIFAVSVLFIMLVQKMFLFRFTSFSKRTKTSFDDAFVQMLATIHPPFYWFLAFFFALQSLAIEGAFQKIVSNTFVIWGSIQVIVALQIFIDFIITTKIASKGKHGDILVSGILSGIVKIALWMLAGVFVLSNLGVNVNSLIAGLGIGGIAVALAAQNILGDLFSSLVIYFDRPFSPGDYIVVGNTSGTVRKIGIKSTRIQALSGEEIVVPNKDIVAARISNLKRMTERRVSLKIGVQYGTGTAKLAEVPVILEDIVSALPHVVFKSAYLTDFGDSGLVFELVYVVTSRDFTVYREAQQQIILAILQTFEKRHIGLALPVPTVRIAS